MKEKLVVLIKEKMKANKDRDINPEDDLIYDLGLDSLALVELMMDIEDELNVSIDDENMEIIYKFGDLLEYLEANAN